MSRHRVATKLIDDFLRVHGKFFSSQFSEVDDSVIWGTKARPFLFVHLANRVVSAEYGGEWVLRTSCDDPDLLVRLDETLNRLGI